MLDYRCIVLYNESVEEIKTLVKSKDNFCPGGDKVEKGVKKMKTYKELMREDFVDSLYRPLLSKYVDWLDVICLCDGEKIEVNLNEGKIDDGIYYLERRNASLFFYRAGHFKKILIANKEGIFSFTSTQFKKAKISGCMITTQQWKRFFAKN